MHVLVSVPQPLRDHSDRDAVAEQAAGMGISEGMKAYTFEPNLAHDLYHAGPEAIWRIISSVGLTEDQVMILVISTE